MGLDADGWEPFDVAYRELMAKYQPSPIRDDDHHQRVIEQIAELQGEYFPHKPFDLARSEMVDLLATLCVAYEGTTWGDPVDNYQVAALMIDNQGDPTLSFGRGEEGKKNALAYTSAIRAGDTERAVEIARRCRAAMAKRELIREDRER